MKNYTSRVFPNLFVGKTPDAPGLVLEGGVPPSLGLGHVPEVPDEQPSVGRAHHQPVPAHAHRVHLWGDLGSLKVN